MVLQEGLKPLEKMLQHPRMHRMQQVVVGQIGYGATGESPEGDIAGVNTVRSEGRHVTRGMPRGVPVVVAGGVVVVGWQVIAQLAGGALAPDAGAVAQVLEVAVLRIVSQPRRNSRRAPTIVAVGAQGGEDVTLTVV
jgi:hypothetical protein